MCGIIAALMAGDRTLAVALEGLRRMEYRGYDSAGVALIPNNSAADVGKPRRLIVEKRKGKVANLSAAVANRADLQDAGVAVAHTRWATHGPPTDANSHPHTSCDGRLAVVHNGIIENFSTLKDDLLRRGYVFKSDTDSEVLAVLIRDQQLQQPGLALECAVALALAECRGAWAVCVVDEASPDLLVGARKGSPLILGECADGQGLVLASDATAVAGIARSVVYLEEDDVVSCVRDPVTGAYSYSIGSLSETHFSDFYATSDSEDEESGSGSDGPAVSSRASDASSKSSSSGQPEPEHESSSSTASSSSSSPSLRMLPPLPRALSARSKSLRRLFRSGSTSPRVRREPVELTLNVETIQKNGYKHFMLKEIMEQPAALRQCLRGRICPETGHVQLPELDAVLPRVLRARRIIVCACGTSWHAGLVAEYLIEGAARIPVEVEYASEFRYRSPLIFEDDVVIVTSQSGETADTLEAVRLAKRAGALTLSVVNVVGSSIARETDAVVYLQVGPEIGVASTKAFTGQVLVLSALAVVLGRAGGALSDEQALQRAAELQEVPGKIEAMLTEKAVDDVRRLSASLRYAKNFLYLGRGYNFPVALESALKLKEVSYVHAEGYPAAEMKHGPISLIDRQMPVCVIAPKSFHAVTFEKVRSNIQEVVARSGNVLAITDDAGAAELATLAEHVIVVPPVAEWLSPLVTCIPLQLLSYFVADYRGCEIDSPRNLAKSVTVE